MRTVTPIPGAFLRARLTKGIRITWLNSLTPLTSEGSVVTRHFLVDKYIIINVRDKIEFSQ